MTDSPRVALAPRSEAFAADAVAAGGGVVVDLADRPDAVVWTTPGDWADLGDALDRAPGAGWVQLPFAGVEEVAGEGLLTADRTWTCAKGVYSEPVAEHALALALAGLRSLAQFARAGRWTGQAARTLYDAPVVVLGGGGITEALVDLLRPFRCDVTVVRRDAGTPVEGAARTVGTDQLDDVLPHARVVVLALALTPDTEHVIGARQLERMASDAVLVNVARGRHVDTDALVRALREERIGAAALDVTEPEPLPDDSPLWSLPTCLITPHTANPWSTAQPLLAARIAENVRRFAAGGPLLGLVDADAGY
ncbi:MAG TPA: NAD(P)-dependent oxidoreductase [Mycobacteriales bacterium]|nr:NAD(P)-dependent oxidoreductase [Mycobacteriales bacterium]